MIKTLLVIFIYLIIVISIYIIIKYDLIETHDENFHKLNKTVEFNLKNEEKIKKILTERLLYVTGLINNGEMSYDEWLKYIRNLPILEIEGNKYYLVGHEYVEDTKEIITIMTPPSFNWPNGYNYSTLWSEWYLQEAAFEISGGFNVEKNHNEVMLRKGKINVPQTLSYNRIDHGTSQNVVKNSIYVKWISKEGHEGVLYMGYYIENLNENIEKKNLDLIYKPDLIFSSLLLLLVSLIILSTKSEYSIYKAIFFILMSHLYILSFLDTDEPYSSDIQTEIQKGQDIGSSILGMSFLSGVNIFIMNFIYQNKKELFLEISAMFGVSILLLLVAIYKAAHKNYLSDLISARITNQLVFNLAVFLNGFIIMNFIFYTLFYIYIYKKK
jgi:hypothetical protein